MSWPRRGSKPRVFARRSISASVISGSLGGQDTSTHEACYRVAQLLRCEGLSEHRSLAKFDGQLSRAITAQEQVRDISVGQNLADWINPLTSGL